jgi:hypothetical protein
LGRVIYLFGEGECRLLSIFREFVSPRYSPSCRLVLKLHRSSLQTASSPSIPRHAEQMYALKYFGTRSDERRSYHKTARGAMHPVIPSPPSIPVMQSKCTPRNISALVLMKDDHRGDASRYFFATFHSPSCRANVRPEIFRHSV